MSETATPLDVATLPASGIIEFLGGVRPLAKKLDLAASTVQGWKLRDHIPEQYHHRLKNLLQEAQADLDSLEPSTPTAPATPVVDAAPSSDKPAARPIPTNPNAAYFAMPQATVKYWVMSSIASLGLLAIVTLILLVVFFGHDFFEYLSAEHEMASVAPQEVAPAPAPMPAPSQPPANLESDLQQSREAIDTTLDSVKKIKQDASPDQTALVQQIDRIQDVVSSLRSRVDDLDKTLKEKGVDTGAIRQEISDLSRRDVLAAALLLGVAQVHGMLDQQANFAQDLAFLKALLANNPEMIKSLDKLAPFAEKGLMTREQMLDTLNMISDETVKVSHDQPNLTWTQKIWTALNNVIEIRRKAPEPVQTANGKVYDTSTPQGQVAQAKDYIANDDFALAAQLLQTYQGPGAAQIQEITQNLEGRDAAQTILERLLQKSQSLLNVDQLQKIMIPTPVDAAPAGTQ